MKTNQKSASTEMDRLKAASSPSEMLNLAREDYDEKMMTYFEHQRESRKEEERLRNAMTLSWSRFSTLVSMKD